MAFSYRSVRRTTDKWWHSEYRCNIHSYLLSREGERMQYEARSPQIHMRPILIKTIKSISKKYEMSNVCVHLAVFLLDYFMDNHDLKLDTILLVSFACLTLAAKVEEHCQNVPKLNQIRTFIRKEVSNLYFRRVEMKILTFFNFNVAVPTVAHFIEFYKEFFYSEKDFNNGSSAASILKDRFHKLILIYQNISLESIKLIPYSPSMVAASIILATRHSMELTPCWTEKLRKITGYLKKDLVQCCSLLGRNVMQHRKYVSRDEGYYSSSPGFQSPVLSVSKKKRNHIDIPDTVSPKRLAL